MNALWMKQVLYDSILGSYCFILLVQLDALADYHRWPVEQVFSETVALFTIEAEYIVVGSCAQNLWMKRQLEDFGVILDHIPLKCDNTNVINLTKYLVMHSRTKHIEIRHYFLRVHVLKGDWCIEFIDSKHQLADIFTKPLTRDRFFFIRNELDILDGSSTFFRSPKMN